MKKILFVGLFFKLTSSFAGGFMFPNLPYDYAKIYLFNANEAADTVKPDFSVYMNGVYAASKLGNGWDFSDQMNVQMNTVFRLGVDMMVAGLSGCYIPRHGIIYFDKTGKAVASISICFECQRIQFWSSDELPEFGTKYSEKDIPKVEKQFLDLEAIMVKNGIPVYKKTADYISYAAATDSLYENNGEIIFDYTKMSAFNQTKFTKEDIQNWLSDHAFKFRLERETSYSQREGDTSSWTYPVLTHKDGTRIIFSEQSGENYFLTEASILTPELKLPNGISVGMSLEQVQNSFLVWDGIAYPSSIIVNYSDANIRYVFENRTLKRIELVMI